MYIGRLELYGYKKQVTQQIFCLFSVRFVIKTAWSVSLVPKFGLGDEETPNTEVRVDLQFTTTTERKIYNLEVTCDTSSSESGLLVVPSEVAPFQEYVKEYSEVDLYLRGIEQYLLASAERREILNASDVGHEASENGGILVPFSSEEGVALGDLIWSILFSEREQAFVSESTISLTSAGRDLARECNLPEELLASSESSEQRVASEALNWQPKDAINNLRKMADCAGISDDEEEAETKKTKEKKKPSPKKRRRSGRQRK